MKEITYCLDCGEPLECEDCPECERLNNEEEE